MSEVIRKKIHFYGQVQGTEAQIDEVILSVERGTYVRITNMEVKTIPVLENERGFGTR